MLHIIHIRMNPCPLTESYLSLLFYDVRFTCRCYGNHRCLFLLSFVPYWKVSSWQLAEKAALHLNFFRINIKTQHLFPKVGGGSTGQGLFCSAMLMLKANQLHRLYQPRLILNPLVGLFNSLVISRAFCWMTTGHFTHFKHTNWCRWLWNGPIFHYCLVFKTKLYL